MSTLRDSRRPIFHISDFLEVLLVRRELLDLRLAVHPEWAEHHRVQFTCPLLWVELYLLRLLKFLVELLKDAAQILSSFGRNIVVGQVGTVFAATQEDQLRVLGAFQALSSGVGLLAGVSGAVCLTENLDRNWIKLNWLGCWTHAIWTYVWILLQVASFSRLLVLALCINGICELLLFWFDLASVAAHRSILQLEDQLLILSQLGFHLQFALASVSRLLLQEGLELLLAWCEVSLFCAVAQLTATQLAGIPLLGTVRGGGLRAQLTISNSFTMSLGHVLWALISQPEIIFEQELIDLYFIHGLIHLPPLIVLD